MKLVMWNMSTSLCKMMRYQTDFKVVKAAAFLCVCFFSLALTACSAPVSPKNPTEFSAIIEDDSFLLTWERGDDAEFYRLYRRVGNNKDFKYIDDLDLKETQYRDVKVKNDMPYSYKITSVNGNKETEGVVVENLVINSAVETEKTITAPKISSVTKMNKYTSVVLFDSDNENCSYQISRCGQVNGKYELIGTTSERAYYDYDTEGKNFYYIVSAVADEKKESSLPQKTGYNARSVYRIPAMMYHEFVTQEDLDDGILFDEYAIWKDEFESDLQWLKENGYTTITSKQLIDFLEGKGTLPSKPILLTIDDGKYGVYKHAYPLLKEYNMTASLSLIGSEIDAATLSPDKRAGDGAPYCRWDEISEMQESGYIEMVSHTQNLHVFSHDNRCGANSAEGETLETFLPMAQFDFSKFNRNLKTKTGTTTLTMSYPYSKRSPVADEAWLKSGYKILFCGDSLDVSPTQFNCYISEAGINLRSSLMRRVARMTGTSLQEYIMDGLSE